MKKPVLTILIFLVTITLVYAQKWNKKSVVGINSGVSIPFADFADKKMENYSGFAGTGGNIEIDFFRYTGRFFGLVSNIGYSNIFFSEKAYKSEYDRVLANYGENIVKAGNYQVLKGLVGFILKIPETRHIEVLLVFQAGCAMSIHPDLLVTNSELGVINSVRKDTDWSAMSNTGIKINYWLTEKYGISLNYGLNFTTPGFGDVTSIERVFFLPVRYQIINVGLVINLIIDGTMRTKAFIFLLLVLTVSCDDKRQNFDRAVIPPVPVNFSEVNSAYDDYNSDLSISWNYKYFSLLFSSSRDHAGDNFDFIRYDCEAYGDLVTGEFKMSAIRGNCSLVDKINSSGNELGPFFAFEFEHR